MSEEKPENTVYKQVSKDIRSGLRDIYQQISTASHDQPQPDGQGQETRELFLEASSQLTEVLKATESATMHIMEIVERHLDLQEQNAALLEKLDGGQSAGALATLKKHNNQLGDDLTTLLTTLSFQDITGQRIKRVVRALEQIESMVVELYISSGLMMEGAEKDPAKGVEALQDEARQAMRDFREKQRKSELKGPDTNGVSQGAIDDMLSQLGL